MTVRTFLDGRVSLHCGDCREVMASLPEASVDSIVTDPPYGLGFMGKKWDDPGALVERRAATENKWDHVGGNHNPSNSADAARTARVEGQKFGRWCEEWAREALRVLKPGGHLLAFSGTRTYHRLACAIEDAGFEIRDQIGWAYGSGFPKSLNVAKAIDAGGGRPEDIRRMEMGDDYEPSGRGRVNYDHGGGSAMNGSSGKWIPQSDAAREWQGWGTALKPAWEPICVARKPLIGTVAENVLKHGAGALNIDGCRVEHQTVDGGNLALNPHLRTHINGGNGGHIISTETERRIVTPHSSGRFPANLIHDGSDEVLACFPSEAGASAPVRGTEASAASVGTITGERARVAGAFHSDTGSAARFFYTAKADSSDRIGSKHPTVKPIDLMQYLVRLVTPKGGVVLDPFAGTGTTGEAAWREGMNAILIEREAEYQEDIARRMDLAVKPSKRAAVAKTKGKIDQKDDLPLFEMGGE